jgi:CHRD domain
MTRAWAIRVAVALSVIGLTASAASADAGSANLSARLSGFSEVPPNLTAGSGSFHATVQGTSLTYKLSFSNLSATATQSHIHFAQSGVNGGVFLFLCGSAATPGPAGTPTCPAAGGTVTRTVTAADLLAVPAQGVAAGDFAGVLRIIRSGDAYVNVHTTTHPAGEIRGQVQVGGP